MMLEDFFGKRLAIIELFGTLDSTEWAKARLFHATLNRLRDLAVDVITLHCNVLYEPFWRSMGF